MWRWGEGDEGEVVRKWGKDGVWVVQWMVGWEMVWERG